MLGDLKTTIILTAVIAAILIVVLFIIGLLIAKNICSSFVSAGIAVFLAGFASLTAGLACKTAAFFSRIDPSNFIKFIANTIDGPLLICGVILIGVSVLCFIAALMIKTVVYAERKEDGEEDDGDFSYEYSQTDPKKRYRTKRLKKQ